VLAADLAGAWELVVNRQHELLLAAAMVLLLVCWVLRRYSAGQVYLLDFAVTKAPDSWRMPRARFLRLLREHSELEPEEIDFQDRMLQRSGLGPQETCATPGILTHNSSIEYCRAEFMELCFSAIEEVLAKTGVKPHQIGFIITNSSLFNPTPSLSATIINRFKLPETTINYSLGGMGCSAGVVALDLAKQMLQLHPNTYALVVSHENITNAWYDGHDRTMMVPNCLFRANGSAVLLSNHAKDSYRAKYRLAHLVRTILAADDEAFKCIHQVEDAEAKLGVSLRKELVTVAGRALKANLTRLGPKVLPLREKVVFGANLVTRQLARTCRPLSGRLPAWALKPYVPNFGSAFNHMCIHTGGRGVLDGIEKQLGLSDAAMLPSRAALFRFGNTSSTSIW
jgi:3-ketoacyl-CoA synthase